MLHRKILHVFSAKGTDSHREAFPFMFRAPLRSSLCNGHFSPMETDNVLGRSVMPLNLMVYQALHRTISSRRGVIMCPRPTSPKDLYEYCFSNYFVMQFGCQRRLADALTRMHACTQPHPHPPRSTYPTHTLGICLLFRYANVSVSGCVQAEYELHKSFHSY